MDYDPPWMHNPLLFRSLEEMARLDLYWAWSVATRGHEEAIDHALNMSERIAFPLAYALRWDVRHIAILLNAVSEKWLFTIKEYSGCARS